MDRAEESAEKRAAHRAGALTGLLWHIAVFLIVNAFLWFLDLRQGGADWAYWVTILWGIGLAFHATWYFISEREVGKYERSLKQERRL